MVFINTIKATEEHMVDLKKDLMNRKTMIMVFVDEFDNLQIVTSD